MDILLYKEFLPKLGQFKEETTHMAMEAYTTPKLGRGTRRAGMIKSAQSSPRPGNTKFMTTNQDREVRGARAARVLGSPRGLPQEVRSHTYYTHTDYHTLHAQDMGLFPDPEGDPTPSQARG